jgi:hypothetical protein
VTETVLPYIIAGPDALADFRRGLTGDFAFELLRQAAGRLLVQLPVGVGKTKWLIEIIGHALANRLHDVVVVLVPRWDILREILTQLPVSIRKTVLHPRPRKRCGALDKEWVQYEQQGCGHLGRELLCKTCPVRNSCAWPNQYGIRLRRAQLILGTQQHLVIDPHFLNRVRRCSGTKNPLVLIDESDLLIRGAERTVSRHHLGFWITVQEAVLAGVESAAHSAQQWLNLSRLILDAPTADLQVNDWRFPAIGARWALAVQQMGVDRYGRDFRFLGHELRRFGHSDRRSRERTASGDLRFATLPSFGNNFIIFSGSIAQALARYRLDPDHRRPALLAPFQDLRAEHPETLWYNINDKAGAAKFFPGNTTRILDFFAQKIAANIRNGKRTLLISRKKFVALCRTYLSQRLNDLRVGPVKIVTGNWTRHDLSDPRTVPLINYGVAGLNRFEHCEAAYCLTGYYVSATAVEQTVQDIEAIRERFPITVQFAGTPPRRLANVHASGAADTIVPIIAPLVLEQKEADVIVQAVGRVRPFTQPREIITFHCGRLPRVTYSKEFLSLALARSYFGIPTASEAERLSRSEQARQWRAQGWPLQRIANELGVSLSTVKRYLRQ